MSKSTYHQEWWPEFNPRTHMVKVVSYDSCKLVFALHMSVVGYTCVYAHMCTDIHMHAHTCMHTNEYVNNKYTKIDLQVHLTW